MKNRAIYLKKIQNKVMVHLESGALPFCDNPSMNSVEYNGMKAYLFLEQDKDNYQEVNSDLFIEGVDAALLLKMIGKFFSYMPDSFEGLESYIPDSLVGEITTDHITFYGGSFNPWHEGHHECVDQCPNKSLVIVPDSNPWKEGQSKREGLWRSFWSVADHFKEHTSAVYPGFWALEEKNPTVDWIPHVKSLKTSFLMGDDNFMSIERWNKSDVLLSSLEALFIVPRLEKTESLEKMKAKLNNQFSSLEIKILNEHAYQDISSTQIRKREEL